MNYIKLSKAAFRTARPILMFLIFTAPLWAQDTTTTSYRHGSPVYETVVRNAKVVYVEGNDLVLRLENGKVEHLTVPDTDRFHIDGKIVSVRELEPGTTLTETITTVTSPRYVNTVKVIKGKVWHVGGHNTVILHLPDGTNQLYTIPNHATLTLNGKPATAVDLRKGMTLEATIIKDEPQTIVEHRKYVSGEAPPPLTPPMVGILLIQPLSPPSPTTVVRELKPEPSEEARAESMPAELPKTGSSMPLLGLLGSMAIGFSLLLGVARKKVTE